jgi:hypothetical protein
MSKEHIGRGSAVNKALDGSTYPGQKLVPSSFCKKIVSCMKCNNLYLGLMEPYWFHVLMSNDVSSNNILSNDVSSNNILSNDVSSNNILSSDVTFNDILSNDVTFNILSNDVISNDILLSL